MNGAYAFVFRPGEQRIQHRDGEEFFSVRCLENDVSVCLRYTASDRPLILTAPASPGDGALLVLTDPRISLTVGGTLQDEEWPFGEPLFGDPRGGEGDLALEPAKAPEEPDQPSVIRTFSGAARIRRRGVNIGDCMPFGENGRYHLFYLYDRHHHGSKWGFGAHQWAHVSTADLETWEEHPMAVGIDEPWEGSICTGSVMKAGGRYYAWYAVRMSDRSPARLTCSVSDDLYHFEKTGRYFVLPDRYDGPSARDPKVFPHGGLYHMFVTTSLRENGNGCLAHLTSADLSDWADAGPVLAWDNGDQPECSDWFFFKGRFYLVFGIGGTARYRISDSPFTGWEKPENDLIPCGNVPKAAPFGGKLLFSGFVPERGYGGRLKMILADAGRDGLLSFSPVPTV